MARLGAGDPPDEDRVMPLSVNDTVSRFGTPGRSGAPGTDPAQGMGGTGGFGRAGQAIAVSRTGQGFTGDAGDDLVVIGLAAAGGAGGAGGFGGRGAGVTSTTTELFGPTSELTSTTYTGTFDGGSGGAGGSGGRAEAVLATLTFDLAALPGGSDAVRLTAQATGGGGNLGGIGGFGTSSAGTASYVEQSGAAGSLYTRTIELTGSPGGQAGLPGPAGAGGVGLSAFDHLTVTGETVALQINGLASGGNGAFGTQPRAHGAGSVVADALAGGDGGSGGAALARATDLAVTATGSLDLNLTLSAVGGFGGAGNTGAPAVASTNTTAMRLNGVGAETTTTTYALAGHGGDGGAGGAATVLLTGAGITGSAQADSVRIALRAQGGDGGQGGQGGLGVANSLLTTGPLEYPQTFIVRGTPDGPDGADGAAGAQRIAMTDNVVTLGDDNDSLQILLAFSGSGARSLSVARNRFDGGAGTDSLSLGDGFTPGQPDILFNVQAGLLRIGGAGSNVMQGFERFTGGAGNDRFLDGAGDQAYAGRGGADRFEFAPGRAGNDTILGFESAEDVVRLRGFGPTLDEFVEVLAAARQVQGGVLIQTAAASTVLLAGVRLFSLEADDFLF